VTALASLSSGLSTANIVAEEPAIKPKAIARSRRTGAKRKGETEMKQSPNQFTANSETSKTLDLGPLGHVPQLSLTRKISLPVNGPKNFIALPDGRAVGWTFDEPLLWTFDEAWSRLEPISIAGAPRKIWSVHLLSNGLVAVADGDFTISVVESATWQTRVTLAGHEHEIGVVRSLRDGRICSCSSDATIRIWNSLTGACEVILKSSGAVSAAADEATFDAAYDAIELEGGDLLAWYGNAQINYVRKFVTWALEKGTAIHEIGAPWPDGPPFPSFGKLDEALRHSPIGKVLTVLDGGQIISVHGENEVRCWDGQTGDVIAASSDFPEPVEGAILVRRRRTADGPTLDGPIGTLLWSRRELSPAEIGRNAICRWNDEVGPVVQYLGDTEVNNATPLSDGRILTKVTRGQSEHYFLLWDAETLKPLGVFEGVLSVHAIELADGRILSWTKYSKPVTAWVWRVPAFGEEVEREPKAKPGQVDVRVESWCDEDVLEYDDEGHWWVDCFPWVVGNVTIGGEPFAAFRCKVHDGGYETIAFADSPDGLPSHGDECGYGKAARGFLAKSRGASALLRDSPYADESLGDLERTVSSLAWAWRRPDREVVAEPDDDVHPLFYARQYRPDEEVKAQRAALAAAVARALEGHPELSALPVSKAGNVGFVRAERDERYFLYSSADGARLQLVALRVWGDGDADADADADAERVSRTANTGNLTAAKVSFPAKSYAGARDVHSTVEHAVNWRALSSEAFAAELLRLLDDIHWVPGRVTEERPAPDGVTRFANALTERIRGSRVKVSAATPRDGIVRVTLHMEAVGRVYRMDPGKAASFVNIQNIRFPRGRHSLEVDEGAVHLDAFEEFALVDGWETPATERCIEAVEALTAHAAELSEACTHEWMRHDPRYGGEERDQDSSNDSSW
jgi:WD40 repeat protein